MDNVCGCVECVVLNHSNNNSKSSSEDIASERGFVFFLLSAAFIIFLPAAVLVADTSAHVCRAPVTRHLVAVTCSSCVSPTLVVMRQSYAILLLSHTPDVSTSP